VELENAAGRMRFTKDDSGAWTMEGLEAGMRIKQDEWEKLLKKALYIRMNKPLGDQENKEWGLGHPALTLRMETGASGDDKGGAEAVSVSFGKKDEDKNIRVAKSSNSRFFVSVTDYSVSELVEAEKKMLLEEKVPTE